MSRYIERAENYARFIDVNYNLSLELGPGMPEQWKPLIITTGDWPLYETEHGEVTKSQVINFLCFDDKNPNCIRNCIIRARENARQIRPEITKEVWEQINALYYYMTDTSQGLQTYQNDLRTFLSEIKKGCQLLYGIYDATISRNQGWNFRMLGQYLERADKTLRVLDVKYHILLPSTKAVGSTLDLVQWASLLKSVSAYDMYRKEYGTIVINDIVNFLLFDRNFARSVFRCIIEAHQSIQDISGLRSGFNNEAERKLGSLKAKMEYKVIEEVLNQGLHEFIDELQIEINNINDSIIETFFVTEEQVESVNKQSQS